MQLRVLLESTGQSWTLQPNREYLMGTSPDCDIMVTPIDNSIAYIKFKFDNIGSFWHVENLQKSDFTTLLNTQTLTRSIIQAQSQLKVVGQSIVLLPEMANNPQPVYTQQRDASSLDPIVDKVAEYAKIGLANANKLVESARETTYEVNERSSDHNQINKLSISQQGGVRQGERVITLSRSGISSPTDGIGINLADYSLNTTMQISRTETTRICGELYTHVIKKINGGSLGNARGRIITYKVNLYSGEDLRDYIIANHTTLDKTRTTILIRFLESGDNLYLGLDAYVLGQLNQLKFFGYIFMTIIVPLFVSNTLANILNMSSMVIFPFWVLITLFMWRKVITRYRYEGDLGVALRQEFPGKIKSSEFGSDDIIIFIKTTLYAAVSSIREVLQDKELPIESLDTFLEKVTGGSTVNITNSGSGTVNAQGAAFGDGSRASYSTTRM